MEDLFYFTDNSKKRTLAVGRIELWLRKFDGSGLPEEIELKLRTIQKDLQFGGETSIDAHIIRANNLMDRRVSVTIGDYLGLWRDSSVKIIDSERELDQKL